MPAIMTSSGQLMPHCCDPSLLRIPDIADGLSKKARFSGQGNGCITIAEHSVLMALKMFEHTNDRQLAATALMHDAVEAYWDDIPAPYKTLVPQFKEIEEQWIAKICRHYGCAYPLPEIVHQYDRRIRLDEVAVLFPDADPALFGCGESVPLNAEIRQWAWKTARRRFIETAAELGVRD